MKYACLVYIEGKKEDDSSESVPTGIVTECDASAAAAWLAELQQGGHLVFSAGLQSVRTAITVRRRNNDLSISDGPFTETKEFLGGFTIIEARDMNEAIQLVSKFQTPTLTIEVRPLKGTDAELTGSIDRNIAEAMQRNNF